MFAFSGINAQTVITHSESQTVVTGASVACIITATGLVQDNRYYREFDLAGDFGISESFLIDSVQFGIEQIVNAPAGGFPVDINLYTVAAPGFPFGALTPLASTSVLLLDQNLTNVSFPIDATANSGDVIVMEVSVPTSDVATCIIGANSLGQTDISYLESDTCGIYIPTDLVSIGFPDAHMIMNMTGSSNVGINDNSFGEGINIAPNPANENVIIELGTERDVNVSIFNIEGREVYSLDHINDAEIGVSLNGFSNGVYFVKVQSNNQQKVIKLIKQ